MKNSNYKLLNGSNLVKHWNEKSVYRRFYDNIKVNKYIKIKLWLMVLEYKKKKISKSFVGILKNHTIKGICWHEMTLWYIIGYIITCVFYIMMHWLI